MEYLYMLMNMREKLTSSLKINTEINITDMELVVCQNSRYWKKQMINCRDKDNISGFPDLP